MYCYNCATSNATDVKTNATTCANENATENCSKQGNGYAKISFVEEADEDTLMLSNVPFEAPSEVEEGGRNNTLASYVGSLLGKKLKKATVLKKALKYNEES